MTGLANALANEGAAHGILANTVLPMGATRLLLDSAGSHRAENPVLDAFFRETTPERVVPLVVWLASRACDVTHQLISASAGRYARVFIGLAEGWLADRETDATAEDIAAHASEILASEPYIVPDSVVDEITPLLMRLGLIPR